MPDKEPEFCYVTTTGWKSGKPHEIEIWFVSHAGAYYIVAEVRAARRSVTSSRRRRCTGWWAA